MEVVNAPIDESSADLEQDRESLDQLRELLLSADRAKVKEAYRRLDAIEKRLDDHVVRAKDVSEVIVPVLREHLGAEQELRDVLKPVLVQQFHQTARTEPDVMAEALFPILGPAMRKMIANIISPDKQSRRRTYRLEQLLLIDKETGLPLSQVASEAVVSQDADMVSGMLSAIQSFVHDAFSADEFDGLNTLQVGELSVWIEWGPSAVLAAVVRGAAPQHLRESMQIYLEQLHHDHGQSLIKYDGEASEFEHLKPELTELLDNHDGSLKNRVKSLTPQIKRLVFGGSAVALLLLAWYAYSANDARNWQRYVTDLDAIPGIVIIDHDRGFRAYRITGLKDPMTSIPDALLNNTNINPAHVSHVFEAYQALHPNLVLQRLKAAVPVPEGVSLALEGSVLTVTGDVSYPWLQEFRQKTGSIAGVERVVYSGN